MTEFLLATPLLMFVLATTLFMGWQMMRKQHVIAASRYSVWRAYEVGGVPSGAELNQKFLRGESFNVTENSMPSLHPQNPNGGFDEPVTTWASSVPAEASQLTNELLLNEWNQSGAQGRTTQVWASFNTGIKYTPRNSSSPRYFWNDFYQSMGQMDFCCGREGLEWFSPQTEPWLALRQLYYSDLDEALTNLNSGPGGANGLANMTQDLYNGVWNR